MRAERMRRELRSWSIAIAACTLVVAGCRTPREVLWPRSLPIRSAEKVIERVLDNDPVEIRYYSAKADVDLAGPQGGRSFKAHIRSVQDSAAWVSVTPALGIEVARAVITHDSLKLIDKLNDQYWLGDTAAAEKRFGLQPSLALLQDALLGRAIGLDPEEKFKIDRETDHYVLTSKERRRFRRAAEDLAPGDTLADDRDIRDRRMERIVRRAVMKETVVLRYWVEPDSFLVTRVLITDLAHDQQADVRYPERTLVKDRMLPSRIELSLLDGTREASGALQLSRIELDGPLNLPFRIPEKFVVMP